jgi:hypothetical protein
LDVGGQLDGDRHNFDLLMIEVRRDLNAVKIFLKQIFPKRGSLRNARSHLRSCAKAA